MKKLCNLLILIFLGIFQAYSTENNPRITYSINDSWQFRLGTSDIGKEGWSTVSIPHTWNAEDCVDDFPGFYHGTGWYRKNIQVDSAMLSRPLYIFFEEQISALNFLLIAIGLANISEDILSSVLISLLI